MLSRKFIVSVKCNKLKNYEIAHLAGLHPSTLSRVMNGIERVKRNDPRVIKVGRVLGMNPEECFE